MKKAVAVYDDLDGAAQAVAREAVQHITGIQERLVTDIAEIGRTLIRVKETVGHGHFLPWVNAEFGWSERTAQSYMAVAERFGPNPQCVAHLPLNVVYQLAAPSTPAEIVEKVRSGETVESDQIKAEIADARREARRIAEEEKRVARRNPKLSAGEVRAKVRRTREEQAAQWAREQEERQRRDRLRQEALDEFILCLAAEQRAKLTSLLRGDWDDPAPGAQPFPIYHQDFVRALERVAGGEA